MDQRGLLSAASDCESAEDSKVEDCHTVVSISPQDVESASDQPARRGVRRTVSSNVQWNASKVNGEKLTRSVTLYVRRNPPDTGAADLSDTDNVLGNDGTLWEDDGGATVELPHEVLHEAAAGAVHGVVNDAVQQAVAAAIEDGTLGGSAFDWHANVFTLVAITGVVLFWRGLWTLWDQLLGLSIVSNVCCLSLGLVTITVFRLLKVPLLESLPGG